MLVKHELWQRIKNLEGKTIYSLTYNRPNTITEVDEKCVFTAERKTPVRFNGKMAIILAAVPSEAVEANCMAISRSAFTKCWRWLPGTTEITEIAVPVI